MEENGRLVKFLYADREAVAEEKEDGNIVRFIRGYDLVASDSESARTYYHYASDEQGSITHVLGNDEKGEYSLKNYYEYGAFGDFREQYEEAENRFGYDGEIFDPIGGQYYLRARYYNPVIGRFTQEDTYYGDGLNLYAYCRNLPVGYTDPSGHYPCKEKQDLYKKYRENARAEVANAAANYDLILKNQGEAAANAYLRSQSGIRDEINKARGYYQDSVEKWHRQNGKYASNAEVGITSPTKTSTGNHGNSLSDPRTNYGYALVDKDTNEILKFGETLYPETRYSKNYLEQNNAVMKVLESGSKEYIHYWQYDMNKYFEYMYNEFPRLLNSKGW